ncbi:EAL domain-containing protein [uncultured Roseibium sp.]|uniref:putative bifunctional diguanylate cyclase/phosphodiesterase n=1 Tax=uncultured Roseibium sp. TaxID=1936171 RepID=UPI002604A5F5|nr:EAL domain-containing protein [uncultured Roseibium sp.]
MAAPLVRRNIVIFFISMSLVLTLALGVYASNRLLTHWLVVRGLEQAFIPYEKSIQDMLVSLQQDRQPALPKVSQLRLSKAQEPTSLLPTSTLNNIRDMLQLKMGRSEVLDAALVFPGSTSSAEKFDTGFGKIDWYKANTLVSADTLTSARTALNSSKLLTAVPDMTLFGKFGPNAVLAYRPENIGPNVPGLLILVTQSELLTSLTPLIWSISAAIGGLCLASIVFAGFLLWMRFYDQVRTNRDIQYLAHHDTLTGLPNRAVFNARLTEALRLSQAKASNIGVMLIDVDKFKEINDTYGHGTGDVFLQIVGERLKSVFNNHLVARLSGDEFAVMLTSISDPARMTRLAADMIAATDAPCTIDGKDIKISLSVGIARATDGSWRASRLLHCADLALYRAKHSGRSTFSWYTAELDAEAQKRKEVEEGLSKALKFNQFKLLYQPQYSLRDGELKGYEALIRWDHPAKGTIRPDIFIPIAEDTGLIEEIGTWVLNHACLEAALWEDKSRRIAVNVSAAQFIAGETQHRVATALRNSGLDPHRLEIEVTESLLISNTEAVVETLRQIRDMGVSIAMDDFGTGYSSLSYLSLFPFDKIKIDKAFIQNLGKDASTDAIVTSIVGLGRSLDVVITAEGVETEEQAVLLSAAGCDLVQGYMFGKPDEVTRHEAEYPVFPLNEEGGLWFPQNMVRRAKSPKIRLAPELAQSSKPMEDPATEKNAELKTAG